MQGSSNRVREMYELQNRSNTIYQLDQCKIRCEGLLHFERRTNCDGDIDAEKCECDVLGGLTPVTLVHSQGSLFLYFYNQFLP